MSMHAICYFSSVTMLSKLQDRQPSRHWHQIYLLPKTCLRSVQALQSPV
jgi:hypothetical protein